MRQKFLAIGILRALTFIALMPVAAFAERFDTSEFAQGLDSSEQETVKLELSSPLDEDDGGTVKETETPDEATLNMRINSFTTLIRTARDATERGRFLLTRASAYLYKARLVRGVKSGAAEGGRTAAESAVADAKGVATTKELSPELRAYALYVQAVALTELERRTEAAKILRSAIELAPRAPFVPGAAFYIAEQEFDRQKFSAALAILKAHLSEMKGEQRAMALYKIAWCHISLQDLKSAQAIFAELVHSPEAGRYGQISIKELAFVAAQLHRDSGILKLAEDVFARDPGKKIEFLSSVYSNLQRLNPGSEHQTVLAELMKVAGAPEKRIQLWLEEMRTVGGRKATERSIALLEAVKGELIRLSDAERERVMRALGEDVALETERTIRSFVDAFTGKVPSRERLSRGRLVNSLRVLFDFHEQFLNKAKSRRAMFQLWIEVCSEHKDYECVIEAAGRVIRDPSLADMRQQAAIERIIALDALMRPGKNVRARPDPQRVGELIAALEQYLADERAPRWTEFANLFSDLHVKERKFEQALPLLVKVHEKEKTEESYFRLQWTRVQAGQYQLVMNAKDSADSKGAPRSKRIRQLEKEAALRLAMGNENAQGEFKSYESGVNRFLELNGDEKEQAIVAAAYLNKLIDRGDLVQAAEKYKSLDKQRLERPRLAAVRRRLAVKLMQQGSFADAADVAAVTGKNDGTLYESVMARMGLGREVPLSDLMSLTVAQREYFLGVLALTRPKAVLNMLRSGRVANGRLSLKLRRMGFLALQIDQDKIEPIVSPAMLSLLGDAVPRSKRGTIGSSTERMAAAVTFPQAGLSEKRLAEELNKSMLAVRSVRKQVPQDLRGRDAVLKRRILKTAMQLEAQMAIAIEKSPVPRGLKGAQRTSYLRGLGDVAKEFRLQASDFQKALSTLQAMGGASDETSAVLSVDRRPAGLSMDRSGARDAGPNKWPWPQVEVRESILDLLNRLGVTAALLVLDLYRDKDDMGDEDYYAFRAGCLLSGRPGEAMQTHVLAELKDAHQQSLIQAWKGK